MTVRAASILSTVAVLAAAASPPAAQAEDDPAVVPYRPSVTSPAQLPAPGWLELEAGGLHARGPGDERRSSLPLTLKLAWTPDWGVVLGGEALVSDRVGGATTTGGGDTTLALKHRFAIDDRRAFGLELGTKFPTARASLGSGRQDWSANGIYSADFGDAWHTDINLNETRQGAPAGQPVTWQLGAAASVARSFNDTWGAVAELALTHQAGTPATDQLLLAGSYAPSKAAVLDFGIAQGLNHATPHLQVFLGGTFRLGRLF